MGVADRHQIPVRGGEIPFGHRASHNGGGISIPHAHAHDLFLKPVHHRLRVKVFPVQPQKEAQKSGQKDQENLDEPAPQGRKAFFPFFLFMPAFIGIRVSSPKFFPLFPILRLPFPAAGSLSLFRIHSGHLTS